MTSLFRIFLFFILLGPSVYSQVNSEEKQKYTRADSLRGSLRPERNYDVLKYHLDLKVSPDEKYIKGSNTIVFDALAELPIMQLDLFKNMHIDSIIHRSESIPYSREHHAVFLEFPKPIETYEKDSVIVYYSGHPIEAKNPPWDGGFVFSRDQNNNPWIGVAVQGTGASLWYPNKDHQSDEPEEALIEIAVPEGLMNVSNGRLIGRENIDEGYVKWSWKVSNPINNYDITLNIGDYVHFRRNFKDLDLDYYVLPYHLEKAKEQFAEVQSMMECFYEKFGPYPFKEDGFKLVETPYLGMEHQSAVAYGNQYMNGYLGRDLSGTGIGLKWDFIIIHESGHEWFGNSITSSDIADMWLHEGFTSYSEAVYIECRWGKEEALEYIKGIRQNIENEEPVIGDYGVNSEGSWDMYYKGSNLLNTIRSLYDNDSLWWKTLRNYSEKFRHQIINTSIAESFFDQATEVNLQPVFDQYLRHSQLPVLQIKSTDKGISYRWKADVPEFDMPVDVVIKGTQERLYPTPQWKHLKGEYKLQDLHPVEEEFYIAVEEIP